MCYRLHPGERTMIITIPEKQLGARHQCNKLLRSVQAKISVREQNWLLVQLPEKLRDLLRISHCPLLYLRTYRVIHWRSWWLGEPNDYFLSWGELLVVSRKRELCLLGVCLVTGHKFSSFYIKLFGCLLTKTPCIFHSSRSLTKLFMSSWLVGLHVLV